MLSATKGFVKWVLPAPVRQAARRGWEELRDWIDTIVFGLEFAVTRNPRPALLIYFGFALGDDLLCTAVLRELRQRGRNRLLMISDHPELFAGNPDADVRPLWHRHSSYNSTVAICRRYARLWGAEFRQPEYAPPTGIDRRKVPARHVIAEMCAAAGIGGSVAIMPYLALTEAEKSAGAWARERLVIQSSGLAARHPAKNKEWFPARFQAVIDALSGEFEFVQLGSSTDPLLRQARDLRGGTRIRDAAAILYHARLFVGLEGFLMHLARAVECPAVIVFGGRVAPWQLGYTCNINLYSEVPCAPCWRTSGCDFDRRCMNEIAVADVVAAIRQMLDRPRNPLVVDRVDVSLSEH